MALHQMQKDFMHPLKNRDLLKSKAYINGKWIENKSTFSVLNPFDEKEIAKVTDLGKKEAKDAIEAASRAFPAWSGLVVTERQKKLIHLAQLLEKNIDDLAALLTLEQGKPFKEAHDEIGDS